MTHVSKSLDRSLASTHPQILSSVDSALWREAYLKAFVDTVSDYYKQYIASLHQFSDGVHYTGYLWDCLRGPERITVQRFRREIALREEVLVMADDHSRDRVIGPPLWPYAPYSVACFRASTLLQSLSSLPEDIYVFDESVSWTLVLTHEHDEKRRYCLGIGIERPTG